METVNCPTTNLLVFAYTHSNFWCQELKKLSNPHWTKTRNAGQGASLAHILYSSWTTNSSLEFYYLDLNPEVSFSICSKLHYLSSFHFRYWIQIPESYMQMQCFNNTTAWDIFLWNQNNTSLKFWAMFSPFISIFRGLSVQKTSLECIPDLTERYTCHKLGTLSKKIH